MLWHRHESLKTGEKLPSWESIYFYCIQDNRFDVKLIYLSTDTVEKAHSVNSEAFLKDRRLSYIRYENVDFNFYRPHVIFMQFPFDSSFRCPSALSLQFVARGARVVYVPYGIEISATSAGQRDHFNPCVVENAWRVYTSSYGIYDGYLKFCRNRHAVRVTGSPKFDALFCRDKYPISEEYRKLAAGKRIVVWKMHFPKRISDQGSSRLITPDMEEYISFADDMDQFDNLFFVVLPHPKMIGRMTDHDVQGEGKLIEQVKKLMEIIQGKPNATIDTSVDYRHSLFHADMIIMDRSATMIEAAMLDVPMLVMNPKNGSEKMVQPVEQVLSYCRQGTTCLDMCAFLREPFVDEEIVKRKEEVKRQFPFWDGRCGERIAEDILEGVIHEKGKRPAISIVLYGAGEVASYYLEQQGWNKAEQFSVLAVADSNEDKWGENFHGYRIIEPQTLVSLKFDAIIIMTEHYYYDIRKYLVYNLYMDGRRILRFDEFVVKMEQMANWCSE